MVGQFDSGGRVVATLVAAVGQDRVVEEDAQPVEIGSEAVEHDNVRCDKQEVAGERRIRFVNLVEKTPRS